VTMLRKVEPFVLRNKQLLPAETAPKPWEVYDAERQLWVDARSGMEFTMGVSSKCSWCTSTRNSRARRLLRFQCLETLSAPLTRFDQGLTSRSVRRLNWFPHISQRILTELCREPNTYFTEYDRREAYGTIRNEIGRWF
jgi:hypothetical protein